MTKPVATSSNWSKWHGTETEWDQQLVKLSDHTIYQAASWARHRADFGWAVTRLIHLGPNKYQAQIFTKKIFGTTIAWIPGGPISNFEYLNAQFIECLADTTNSKRLFVRLNSLEPTSEFACDKLRTNNWKPTVSKLSSGLSLQYDLTESESTRRDLLSKNWARNLHRGETRNSNPYEWKDFSATAIADIYAQLSAYKDLDSISDTPGPEVIGSIVNNCRANLKIVRCDDERGNPLAIRGALVLGEKAWDIFAATTPQGRKQYSSYAVAWTLLNSCAKSSVSKYDLSGVDPQNNKGVYDFKNGTGATQITYVGEWETGTPSFVQPIVGRLINYRNKF